VIAKCDVLLRIENLQQRRRRISPEIRAQFVDFVEHENRIARAGPANVLDDLSRQCADVRATMPAYLGFIAHTAERNPDELSAHG